MKERPILFSAPMVQAILAGTKTQTRRVIKLPNQHLWGNQYDGQIIYKNDQFKEFPVDELICPYGQVGDQLWVREAFAYVGNIDPGWLLFRASDYKEQCRAYGFDVYLPENEVKWKPSIHMPRKASRIQLEITIIRVERLNDISEEDAMAEGCQSDMTEWGSIYWFDGVEGYESGNSFAASAKEAYKRLWEVINGDGSWDANQWVWVIEFRVIK